eukprot:g76883.t1
MDELCDRLASALKITDVKRLNNIKALLYADDVALIAHSRTELQKMVRYKLGSIYAIGGFGLHGARVDSVERLDPTTNRWEEVAPLAQARSGACAAVLDGRLYVMGGANEVNTGLSSVERYDASRNSWERVADMTTARIHASAAVSR